MEQEIYTKDWAEDLMKSLGGELAAAETQEQVLSILQTTANALEDFLGNFLRIKTQIENLNMRNTIVKKYRRQINSMNAEDMMQQAYADNRSDAQALVLYTQLLQQMTLGYYLINKIRDILFEPITYAVGFYGESKNDIEYVENLELEDILEGTLSLSTRIRMSEINFARLEIDLKDVINTLRQKGKVQQAQDDALYREIISYTSKNKHTSQNNKGEWKSRNFAMGHLWETYRYMKLTQTDFSVGALHAIYEEVRRGNLAYYKGGDVLSEQDKFGNQVALTSMAAIITQIPLIIAALRQSKAEDVSSGLQEIFVQKLTDTADRHLQEYVNNDVDKLLTILKLK